MRARIAIAGAVAGTVAGITVSRAVRVLRTWGVDPVESACALPGDELVPAPTAIETRGITIDAPPGAVWPWLAQMGYERGGWYSYDQLDNRGRSLDTILPAFQHPQVGDIVPVSPDGGFEVKVVEPARALVLYTDTTLVEHLERAASTDAASVPAGLAASTAILRRTPRDFAASWVFALEPVEGGRTRLVERFRVRFGQAGPAFRVIGPVLGVGVVVMMRRQLLGIAERAVRTAVAPSVAAPVDPSAAVPAEPRVMQRAGDSAVATRPASRRELVTTPG